VTAVGDDLGMLEILYSRELAALGMDRQLRHWYARGIVTRIAPGAYARTADLAALDRDAAFRLRMIALAQLHPHVQFSHDSAAAMWRLPSLGPWPNLAHVSAPRESGGRSTALFTRHGVGLDPRATSIEGVRVSSLARTLAEMATHRRFARAVAMLDDGLRQHDETEYRYGLAVPGKHEIVDELDQLGKVPGFARAAHAVQFADGRSGSAGESLSRVQMLALGVDIPELQVSFHDAAGWIGDGDFFWRDRGIVGEFDGDSKYGDARRYARGLTAEEVLIAEKRREDRLRRVVNGVVRWDWSVARDRRALAARLAEHGIVPRRSTRWL